MGSMHEEALVLQQLVDDLQTLSLAEAGHLRLNLETLDPAAIATQVVTAHQAQAEAAGVRRETSMESVKTRSLASVRL